MLIYNFQKEFIGIDEKDLKALGFNDLEELRAESADIADMFVKTPGFVHNFQHIHWIDFIAYSESSEKSKVIIHAKGQNYKANLSLKIVYLVDNPSRKAYAIELINLRTISGKELQEIAKDIEKKPAPQTTSTKKALFEGQDLNREPLTPPQEIVSQADFVVETSFVDEPKIDEPSIELEEIQPPIEMKKKPIVPENKPIDNEIVVEKIVEKEKAPSVEPTVDDDFKIDLELDDEIAPTVKKTPKPKKAPEVIKKTPKPVKKVSKPIKKTPKTIEEEVVEPEGIYIYNPQLASDELGLPIELIEEFLEDFIVQADEFKDKIYKALDEEDIGEVKSLSHKLKGVAANLRIEDALEVLTIANTSDNFHKIKTNIDKFYKIMSKLSITKDSDETVEIPDTKEEEDDDHDYDENLFITFEEEEIPNITQEIDKQEILEPSDEATEYDKDLIAKEIGIDRKFFDELFTDFVNDSSVLMDSTYEAIKNNNSTIWKDNIHTLKGMSGNMRINKFTQEIETLLNTDDAKTAKDATDKISFILKQLSKI